MVSVIIIAVVFTGLAAGLFWAAPRGKLAPLSNALYARSRGASMAINVVLAVIMIGFGLIIPTVFLVGNHNRTSAGTGGIKLTAQEVSGREVFGLRCAVCHTLYAASAVGKIGPNLDELRPRPTEQLVLYTIANGCLQDPTASETAQHCLGYGTMPAGIVQGPDAVDVAKFVSAVAGH